MIVLADVVVVVPEAIIVVVTTAEVAEIAAEVAEAARTIIKETSPQRAEAHPLLPNLANILNPKI